MIDGVKEFLDIEIEYPVFLPAPFPAFRHRVQRTSLMPVAVGVIVKDGLCPGFQRERGNCLRNAISNSRDVRFILLSFPGVVRLGF
jgi:hypothetical protein